MVQAFLPCVFVGDWVLFDHVFALNLEFPV